MSTQFPLNLRPKTNASCDKRCFRVISTPDAICGSHASQINSQPFVTPKRALFPEIPGFVHISWQVSVTPLHHWSALNTVRL